MEHEELILAMTDLATRLGNLALRLLGHPLPERNEKRAAAALVMAALPARVQQVLVCLLHGKSEKEIARELHLSIHTVHSNVKSLYRTFQVTTRAELMSLWIRFEPTPPAMGDVAPDAAEETPRPPPAVRAFSERRWRRAAARRR